MDLTRWLVLLVIVGVVLALVPIEATIKRVIVIGVVIVSVVLLLRLLGIWI